MLTRKTPLRANPDKIREWQRRSQKRLPQVSQKRKAQNSSYGKVSREYLAAHPVCECCVLRQKDGENIKPSPANQVHHKRGRISTLLTDTRFFLAVCSDCHRFIHETNVADARRIGALAPSRDWNVSVP